MTCPDSVFQCHLVGVIICLIDSGRRASGVNVMEDAMLGGVTMEICGENCGILTKKLADGGRAGVKIGEGWRRGGRRRGRRRVIKDSTGRFMEYMAAGRIHNKMVGRKEVFA